MVINSFLGQKQFINAYGEGDPRTISAAWQTGLVNSALVGQITGLALVGYLSDKLGYRRTYMIGMTLMALTIFVVFFSTSLPFLAAGEYLVGIPWGSFQTLTTAYAAEVTPIQLRPYLTAYIVSVVVSQIFSFSSRGIARCLTGLFFEPRQNMCWGIGILLSSGVVRATLDIPNKWAYKIPFAIQWVWPLPLFVVAFFAPESPRWLVRMGRDEEAKQAIKRLTDDAMYDDKEADGQLALLKATDAMEREAHAGTSYLDCFRGVNRRRTESAMMVFATQFVSGGPMIGFAILFLQKAGLSEKDAFTLNLGVTAQYSIGTIISFFLMKRFGRRTLYIAGIGAMALTCLVIGCLGIKETKSTSMAIGALLVCLNLAYNVSIGPVCYTLVAELGSTRLRAKTVVLARLTYNLCGLVANTLQPRMIDEKEWDWGAKSGYFWLGGAMLMFTYCYFRLPETKDRSFGELDALFENKVSARHFAKTNVDLFGLGQGRSTAVEVVPSLGHGVSSRSSDDKSDDKKI